MIVPQYWAEAREQHRQQGKQFTIRRFGWSDISAQEAQANAELRAKDALQRLISGEKLERREPKVPYNGADGIPIREEILARHGETIITRNIYGAHCLNTPNVFFADVDFSETTPPRIVLIGIGLGAVISAAVLFFLGYTLLKSALILCLMTAVSVRGAEAIHRSIMKSKGGPEKAARLRVLKFLAKYPEWNFRIYRTPAGLRLLATHRTFDPEEPAVYDCFNALGTDPMYSRMCRNQKCFRARVSPKPWRIGIGGHIKPRPGVWPVKPERMAERQIWISKYEATALSFASCRLIDTVGSGFSHPDVLAVQELHDRLSKAGSDLVIA